jgi:excisionase family DNA binding protein
MADPTEALMSLRAAAEELSVHYMTAYRYVRTGRLPATKVGGEWRVRRADLEHVLGSDPGAVLEGTAGAGDPATRDRFRPRLEDRLLAADEAGAWAVVESSLTSGATPDEVYLRLLVPVLRSIGNRWAAGELTVHDEHRATAIATRLVGRLGPRFRRPGRRRGVVVVGAVSGDTHALATALLADLIRARSFDVVDLGGDTPVESFVEAAGSPEVVAVVITCSHAEVRPAVTATVKALRRAAAGVPILVGGGGIGADEVEALGADGSGTTAEQALDLIDQLTGRTDRRHRR